MKRTNPFYPRILELLKAPDGGNPFNQNVDDVPLSGPVVGVLIEGEDLSATFGYDKIKSVVIVRTIQYIDRVTIVIHNKNGALTNSDLWKEGGRLHLEYGYPRKNTIK